ncbi:MAG: hypothetical protein AB7N73_12265 [Gemmatimonadales bacterium]|jgi:hypothetical protein
MSDKLIELSPLFDPNAGECPPASAIEFYLETPTTLGLLHTLATQKGMTDYTSAIMQAWDAGAAAFLRVLTSFVELECSPITRLPSGARVGLYQLPDQLFVTRVPHVIAGGTEIARFHDHIYVGATGVHDGAHWPVDFDGLRAQIDGPAAVAEGELVRTLTASIGTEWSIDPQPATGFRELIGPALAAYVEDYPRHDCPGDFEPASAQRWTIAEMRGRPRSRRYRSA